MTSSNNLTGYGPSSNAGRFNRLYFDGDERKYEQWEIKFLGYMRLQKLKDVILPSDEAPDATKNEEAFAELIQFLDDRSLSLVMRDAVDDGRKALAILRNHYAGKGKPRIISLYTELTSLHKSSTESVTDYVIKAETAATALRNAGETISDGLLIAMVLKGLPANYKPFVVVITQSEKQMSFTEFKVALRNFEDTEKARTDDDDESVVMKTSSTPFHKTNNHVGKTGNPTGNITCFACGQRGHKADSCVSKTKNKLWCSFCKTSTHTDKACRRKTRESTVKHMNSDGDNSDFHSFAFKVDAFNNDESQVNALLVDCGATTHVVTDASKFDHFDKHFNPEKHFIELADGTKANNVALKKGTVKVSLNTSEGKSVNADLENALYVPSYPQDIFSVQAATEKGATVVFRPDSAELIACDGTKFDIEKRGRLYYLCSNVSPANHADNLKRWHEILGHCNINDVLKLENVVDGMKITDKTNFDCDVCTLGKLAQFRNRTPDARASAPLELVHTDLAGPISPVARDGFRYAISFIDDYSGVIFLYFLKQKSDTVAATERFLADAAPYGEVKRLRSDNGTEYTSKEFQSLCVRNRIKHEQSAPYSPHQNGTAERGWRTLFEMARCLLLDAKLPKELWTYAVMTAAYIRNRCYNSRTKQTPFYLFTGRKPDLRNMHVFGTVCFAYEQNKTKLDARCKKGIFVGYDKNSPAYLVYHSDTNDIRRCRCVKFTDTKPESEDVSYDDFEIHKVPDHVTVPEENNDVPNVADNSDIAEHAVRDDVQVHSRYPKRQHNVPNYLGDYDLDDSTKCSIDYCCRLSAIPQTYQEAISSPEAVKWQEAMEDEMQSLTENDTFTVMRLPDDRKSVGGRWVYSVKLGPDASEKYKARYVAKGYSQVPGVDYHETFAPTARITSVRALMQFAVQYDLVVHQMDVKTAYLNAPIDCELYVDQPEGFQIKSPSGDKLVYRLNKSLYGLKQSGRNWNTLLHSFLIENGFTQSLTDTCLYSKHVDQQVVIVLIWVDDMIVAASDDVVLCEIKDLMKTRFRMKDLGQLTWFLGIQFIHENGCIKMNQTQYLTKLLEKYNMANCKPRPTPCELKLNFSSDASADCSVKYREIVGSLIYAMTCTRPDLSWIVTVLSQHLANPSEEHCVALKHVLRYLKGSLHFELCFRKCDDGLQLIGFSDADWASSVNDRRSTSGYCFSLTKLGPLISWRSRKQPVVALSSCEAEYIALAATVQEGLYLVQLMCDISGGHQYSPVTIYEDNQGAIALSQNPVNHQRSKHIDVRYHFIRTEVICGRIVIDYCPTTEMLADIFTKPATKAKLMAFKDVIFGQ